MVGSPVWWWRVSKEIRVDNIVASQYLVTQVALKVNAEAMARAKFEWLTEFLVDI